MRRTSAASVTPGSSSTSSNEPVGELVDRRRACLARSSDFGVNSTSGLRISRTHLAAQQVEVLRRRGGVHDLDVVLGAQREEALDAGRGVLRALPLVAVGQQHDEARGLPPLVLGGDEELVDDDLRAVHEVAELRLPHHERVLVHDRVAVLEARGRRTPTAASRRPRTCPAPRRATRAARTPRRCRSRRGRRGAG